MPASNHCHFQMQFTSETTSIMFIVKFSMDGLYIGFGCNKLMYNSFFLFHQDVQIGQRMITISTVGVPNTIKKLASHKLQSTLALRYCKRRLRLYV